VTSAAIIGAGDLGGTAARALAIREAVDRIVLIDTAGTAAAGTALDIQQSGAIAGFHTRLLGTTDVSRAVGCDVCIVADRFGRVPADAGGEDLGVAALLGLNSSAPIIFAGARHAHLLQSAARNGTTSRERLIGSSPEALASAVRAMVALEARCAPSEVMLTVLGVPPDGFVVPWSEASIGGSALQHALSAVQLGRLEARVARLWPPGAYALGLAAAIVAEAVIRSARRAFSVLTILDGEFGMRRRVGTLPVFLSPGGIVHRRVPTLSARERTRLETILERHSVGGA
jgi:malate dehydrogenase